MAVATEQKLDPAKTYICAVAFLVGEHAAATNEGEEVRGSDPRIVALGDSWPRYFVAEGTPRGEWPTEVDDLLARNEANARAVEEQRRAAFERAAKANVVKVEAPVYLTLKKDLVLELDGVPTTLRKGSKLPEDHSAVLLHPEAF